MQAFSDRRNHPAWVCLARGVKEGGAPASGAAAPGAVVPGRDAETAADSAASEVRNRRRGRLPPEPAATRTPPRPDKPSPRLVFHRLLFPLP